MSAPHAGTDPASARREPGILHLVETLDVGGLETMVIALARAQRDAGRDARIACLFHDGALAGAARAAGIEVVALGKRPGPDVRVLWRLRALLRRVRPGILHTHNATAHYHGVAAAAGTSVGLRLNTRHGMGDSVAADRGDRLYRLAMRATDRVVAVCEAAGRRFVERGLVPARHLWVIPNGIDVGRFGPARGGEAEALLRSLGRTDRPLVLGTVGRLDPVKDQTTLIDAIGRVRAAGRDVVLVVVGDGPRRRQLEASRDGLGLRDAVHLLGTRTDIPELLRSFDAFALSSVSEGYSIALLEAAASGLPLIATRVGGNAEIVRDGVNGTLVPPRDPDALAHAIAAMADDATRRRRLGRASRDWASREGSIGTMRDRYEALYRSTAAADPSTAAASAAGLGGAE